MGAGLVEEMDTLVEMDSLVEVAMVEVLTVREVAKREEMGVMENINNKGMEVDGMWQI